MTKILVVAGAVAKEAYKKGERDIDRLNDLGVCRLFGFDQPTEAEAFFRGFNLGSKLIDPIILMKDHMNEHPGPD